MSGPYYNQYPQQGGAYNNGYNNDYYNQQQYSSYPANGFADNSNQWSNQTAFNNGNQQQQAGAEADRGLLGAVGGGIAGGYAGHKVNHGFLGAIGGAIAGSLAEDFAKKQHKQHKQHKHHHHNNGGPGGPGGPFGGSGFFNGRR